MEEEEEDDDEFDEDEMETEDVERRKSLLDKFQPKKATTESLTALLQQALQSGDDALLEVALGVRDSAVLSETCRRLPGEHVPVLLAALTHRLACKPARAEHLCAWLTAVLQSGRVESVEHLQPLQNLLQERLEVFPALLKLEGRLSMMGSL
jgi:hypothetical protein